MPVRRGHVAPRTTIIETIIRKFDTHNRSFVVANAQHGLCHIIYCSDGFCRLTGYSRAEVMQRPAVCEFLHGPLTSQHAISMVKEALAAGVERHFEILYYRKDGIKFLCSEVIAPIKSEIDDICLYIINFEDLSTPAAQIDEVASSNNKASRFDRARQSFKQSLKMGALRGRSFWLSSYHSPSGEANLEEEADDGGDREQRPLTGQPSESAVERQRIKLGKNARPSLSREVSGDVKIPRPVTQPPPETIPEIPPNNNNNTRSVPPAAPIASPEVCCTPERSNSHCAYHSSQSKRFTPKRHLDSDDRKGPTEVEEEEEKRLRQAPHLHYSSQISWAERKLND